MGYRRTRKVYVLEFEDMDGLEVRAHAPALGALVDADALPPNEMGVRYIELLADHLISWNLEDDDGAPIPADLKGLHTCDSDFVMELVAAWQNAITGVSAPLGQSSPAGGPFPVLSMPMETLSADRLSS